MGISVEMSVHFLKRFRAATYFFLLAGTLTANARAGFINGYGWITTEALVNSVTGATAATLAAGTCHNGAGACTLANADVLFSTNGISFNANGATISGWLGSSGFALEGLIASGTTLAHLMDATIWEFRGNVSVTGTVASPQAFTFANDDGLTLVVNGQTVINQPGPAGASTTTAFYTGGVNSNAAFDLIYAECCGGPAVLQASLPGPSTAPAPEPDSVLLVGTILAGVAGMLRRKMF